MLQGKGLQFVGHFDLAVLRAEGRGLGAIEGPPGVLAVFLSADPCTTDTARAILIFAPDGERATLVDPPDDVLVTPSLPLVAAVVDDSDGAWRDSESRVPRHKLGGFADWIQGDGRMNAYFTSVLPSSDPEAAEALRRVSIDPESLSKPEDYLRAVRQLEAHGIDPLVLGQASEDFELLAQIDSDERAGLQWGDVGRLFLFARMSDVHARRFDRVVVVGDCY
jgi:hypothetical protein